jgi:hypothetical protein
MKRLRFLIALIVFGLAPLQAALADHNSPHGAGWARMPNDIHNTRIDTLGDSTAFRDFVRYGNGADSINRYASDDDLGRRLQGAFKNGSLASPDQGGMRGTRGSGRYSYASSGSGHGGGRGSGGGRGR